MSEEKKMRLIQRMNTAVEFQKMKLGKALLKKTSEKIIQRAKENLKKNLEFLKRKKLIV